MKRVRQSKRSATGAQRRAEGGANGLALLAARGILGGYLAAHGAQKLFGTFGGHGMTATEAGFDRLGLRPAPIMARVAAVSELGGGLLTVAGVAHPAGLVALAGTMAVASSTHRPNGPFSVNGGFELPLTNMAAALALAVVGPGRYSVDGLTERSRSRLLARLVVVGAAASAAACVVMVLRATPASPPPNAADAAEEASGETGEEGITHG